HGSAAAGRGRGRAGRRRDPAPRVAQRRRAGQGRRRRAEHPHPLRHAAVHRGRRVMARIGPTAGIGTRAVHAGQRPDPTTGAVMTPIYQTSTYAQEALGVNKGYEYARTHNATRAALEGNLAGLEGATHGLVFASGLAATNVLVQTLSAGDHVVCGQNTYGGTFRLFDKVWRRHGLDFTFVDATSTDA